ncbi:hypothetical protein CIB84_005548 [Bambusicola thoracicus]|uniref:Uncharacterized protein n=1 Tax=Bambusicola thoracicus TaxID=9083 RepID=A0A2P4T2Y2_BAMTH|nr:hypothetical protein CIB84_005548 [Bambusicola thoracicus]
MSLHVDTLIGLMGVRARYRRTRRAPGSRAAAPAQSSALRGAGARLGIMAPPKPSSRRFLQPSYAVLQ